MLLVVGVKYVVFGVCRVMSVLRSLLCVGCMVSVVVCCVGCCCCLLFLMCCVLLLCVCCLLSMARCCRWLFGVSVC